MTLRDFGYRLIHGSAFKPLTIAYIFTVLLLAAFVGDFISAAMWVALETLLFVILMWLTMERSNHIH